jgi:hypothetical protein
LDELHQALAVPDWILSAIAQQIVIHVRTFCDCLQLLASDRSMEGDVEAIASMGVVKIPSECRLLAVVANCSHFRTGPNQLPRVWKRFGELFADGAECGIEVSKIDNRLYETSTNALCTRQAAEADDELEDCQAEIHEALIGAVECSISADFTHTHT